MSAQRKVCVVVTARASYARVRSALAAVRDHPMLELQLVMAASALLERYGNAASVVEDEGFEVTRRVHTIVEGESLITSAKSTGLGLVELSTVFADLRPDVVVTIADRFETMASAVAAAYMNIPLAHIQGGEITGSIDEKVRHAVTKLADQHFVATDRARERVIRMGERPEAVHMTGCPSLDLAKRVAGGRREAPLAGRAIPGVGPDVDLTADYVVVLQHPVTTEHDRAHEQVLETLHAVDGAGIPALWFWPNVDAGSDGTSKGIRTFRETRPSSHIHFLRNLPPEDFLNLLARSRCIVGNSSVAIRECSFLGVPAVNIGTRQAGRDRGRNVVDCDYDRAAITRALDAQIQRGAIEPERLYGDGEAGRRIAELLATVELTHEKQLTY
jgi:UDP-hydrolysing UDP-N-acetyl-D-glucosamine 2-epimerase